MATTVKLVKLPSFFLNKIVLITGASSGIGRTLSYWYLNNGAKVALVSRDAEELNNIGKQFPGQSLVVQMDLTDDHQCWDLRNAVMEKFGGIDILINCAGSIFAGDLENTYPQDFDYLMDVNMRTPFLLQQFFLPFLKQSKGCIINISSEKGSRPEAGQLTYCMTKAGIDMLTKASALELAPYGIRVNGVAPCMVDTNLYRYAGYNEQEYELLKKRAALNIPLQRIARDDEVAKAIIFLTSDKAQKITGHIMKVDGGKSLTSRGQVDWHGSHKMTRKFEQEYSSKLNQLFLSKAHKPRPLMGDKQGLENWIDEIQVSTWALKSDEVHLKQTIFYENIKDDQKGVSYLINQKSVQGSEFNPKWAVHDK